MNPDRKLDISVFNGALEIESPVERARYLQEACAGDAERHQRIEALLEAYEIGDSVFAGKSETEDAVSIEAESPSERPGAKIGPYKLLQEIGEGGMGVVYMAQQEEPIQRKVALKIIKVGLDTRQVVARFEAERQALAMMDHPNIAQVFDGGSTESGRPYFVMELVQGVPITEFCDKNKLSTRERIELLIPVCQAIQSAHQKGIIHRDIKPSNVLVTLHHGEPVAKVIDFGVAKATNQKLTEKTLFTNFGMMIGTPAYMSPEQAQMTSMDVDTRTDVYSLGVLLYELLTGTTPLDQKQLLSKGYGEMQRVIAEEEPDKPSLRMSTLGVEKRTAIAKNRSLNAPELLQILKGDLDCITMKCVEKDRRRRYDTPNELVADLKRHLNHEPVAAAPPTVGYRFQKFYQRKKALVHATAGIGLTLILTAVVSILMAIRMNRLRNDAVHSEKKAVTQAAIADAVNKFLNEDLLKQAEVWNDNDPDIKLRTVVERADQAIESKLKNQPIVEAAIRLTLCEIYRSLDDQDKAAVHSRRAQEIYERELGMDHPETLKARVAVIRSIIEEGKKNSAKYSEAFKTASDLLADCRRILGPEHETSLAAIRELVSVLSDAERYREQEPILKEAIVLHEKVLGKNNTLTMHLLANLGESLRVFSSQLEQAIELAREHVRRSESLSLDDPNRYYAKSSLAAALTWVPGNREEARKLEEESLEFYRRRYGSKHWKTIGAMSRFAFMTTNQAESLHLMTEAYRMALSHWGSNHLSTLEVQRAYAEALTRNSEHGKAEEVYLSGLQTLKANFGRNGPLMLRYLNNVGEFYLQSLHNPEKAESYFRETVDLALETQGENSVYHRRALRRLAGIYRERPGWRLQALEASRKLLRWNQENYGFRNPETTFGLAQLAGVLAQDGKQSEADSSIEQAAKSFAKKPPQSNTEWIGFGNLLFAISYSPNKRQFVEMLRHSVCNAPETLNEFNAVTTFYRVAEDTKAARAALQARLRAFPDIPWHWYDQSAAALDAGDIKEHLSCGREMLKRIGNDERNSAFSLLLKTFFIVPDQWTSEELAAIQRVYERLSQVADKESQAAQVLPRAALALADYRLDRSESGLAQLNKTPISKPDLEGLDWAQALAVAALCHQALGDGEKAREALSASAKAIPKSVRFSAHDDLVRWRYLYKEATEAIQVKESLRPR